MALSVPATFKQTHWLTQIALIIAIATLPFIVIYFATKSHYFNKTISVNDTIIHVKFATTSQERERGLCCRNSMPADSGMLFVYDSPAIHFYWMKDTTIPLDMYWIDAKKKIIYIKTNVQPNTYPKRFGPNVQSQYVLETSAGFAKKHAIKVGDTVLFNELP